MASVRISSELRNKIISNVMSNHVKSDPIPIDSPALANDAVAAIKGSVLYKKLLEIKNDPVLLRFVQGQSSDSTSIVPPIRLIMNSVPVAAVRMIYGTNSIDIRLPSPVAFLCTHTKSSIFPYRVEDTDAAMAPQLLVDINAAKSKVELWQDRKNAVEKQVKDLLEQCVTIRQLLLAWPAAEAMLPQDVVEKMHTKKTHTFNAEAARQRANFDPQTANTSLLVGSLLKDD